MLCVEGCGFEKVACLLGEDVSGCTAYVGKTAHLEVKGMLPTTAVWSDRRGGFLLFKGFGYVIFVVF